MLKSIRLASPQDWQQVIPDFDPSKDTWVVADLKAKLEIQQMLFQTYKVLPEEAVLRASEMWLHIYKRLGQNTQIVSPNFARVYLSEKLEQEEESWLRVPGAHKTLLEYIKQLLPLLIYPNSEELLTPWWKDNGGALMRWGRWFYYAKKYVHQFLEQGWVLPTWIPYLLQNDHLDKVTWDRNIYIDLGSQLTQTEALLFKKLSETQEVIALVPSKIGCGEFSNIDRNYSQLGEDLIKNADEKQNDPFSSVNFKRFSTALGEIKDLSAQINGWVSAGYAPHEIAVTAPDIENYWSVMSSYFEIENIPVQKNKVVRAQSYLPIMNWLSRLKLEMGKVSSEDLELDVFADHEHHQEVTHVDFKKIYSLILEDSHLHRIKAISKRYQQNLNPQKYLYLDEFLLWAISYFSESYSTLSLESLLRTLLQESLANVRLKACSWLSCLENAAAKTEISLKDEDSQGVYVENFRSARHLDCKCLYVLGLSESQMKSSKAMGLKASEVMSIEYDLGFTLDLPECQEIDFDADWLLHSQCEEVVASFAETNFAGETDAAAMLWLKTVKKQDKKYDQVDIPQISYWDHLQQNITNDNNTHRANFIDRDLGAFQFPEEKVASLKTLSVSRLQRYSQCPFIFMAESLFKLQDPQILDLDLDVMAFGQFMHKVFQNVITEPFRAKWSEDELLEVLESSKKEVHLPLYDERSWYRVQAMMLKTLKQFLTFEQEWRQTFPQTKTVGKEVSLEACWDQELRDFILLGEKGVRFRGSIDRVDIDGEGHAVILDYKSSKGQTQNYSTWLEKDQLQLSVYAYLVEKGFTELNTYDVLGMGYYVAKENERNKGLWCDEGDGKLFNINKRSRNSMSKVELSMFWEKVNDRIGEIVGKITSGQLQPKPKNAKDCIKCSWRKICRAPHLN